MCPADHPCTMYSSHATATALLLQHMVWRVGDGSRCRLWCWCKCSCPAIPDAFIRALQWRWHRGRSVLPPAAPAPAPRATETPACACTWNHDAQGRPQAADCKTCCMSHHPSTVRLSWTASARAASNARCRARHVASLQGRARCICTGALFAPCRLASRYTQRWLGHTATGPFCFIIRYGPWAMGHLMGHVALALRMLYVRFCCMQSGTGRAPHLARPQGLAGEGARLLARKPRQQPLLVVHVAVDGACRARPRSGLQSYQLG